MIKVLEVRTERRRGVQLAARGTAIVLAGVAAIALLIALAPASPTTAYRASGPPQPLPAEQLVAVTPEQFGGIMVGLRGRPVVVNVWASWCPPCRAEMPLLQRAANEYEGRVTFVGLATKDSRRAAAAFLDEVDVTYANLFDSTEKVRTALGLRGYPTTYFFGADGEMKQAVVGGITEQRLAAQLDDLLR